MSDFVILDENGDESARVQCVDDFPAFVPTPVRERIEELQRIRLHFRTPNFWTNFVSLQMREAYQLLLNEAYTQAQQLKDSDASEDIEALVARRLSGFVDAVLKAAEHNAAYYRAAFDVAAPLTQEIADAAEKLARLLRDYTQIGLPVPPRIYSVATLMRMTDNSEYGLSYETWRELRNALLRGLEEGWEEQVDTNAPPEKVMHNVDRAQFEAEYEKAASEWLPDVFKTDAMREDFVKWWIFHQSFSGNTEKLDARVLFIYFMEKTPSLSELLDTLARMSRAYNPRTKVSGHVKAATASQKRSEKVELIRALIYSLTNDLGFQINRNLLKIVAATSTAFLNDPDADVTYDDVRKAAKLLQTK